MTEWEFFRSMAGMVMPTETHKRVLKAVCLDNPAVCDATIFGLCFGAVCRVPKDKIHSVTLRELQVIYHLPEEAYFCAEARG